MNKNGQQKLFLAYENRNIHAVINIVSSNGLIPYFLVQYGLTVESMKVIKLRF